MTHQPDPILVINVRSVCDDAEIRKYVAAVQSFMPEFNRAWSLPEVDVAFMPHGQKIPHGFGHIQVVADDADQATYLGYHEVAASGHPIGYTFAKTGRARGNSVSGTLTHEIWEARVNPMIDRYVTGPDGRRWDLEVADAPEADEFGIWWEMPGGPVLLSDFCLPSYFDFNANTGRAYDYRGLLIKPIPAMLPGGYLAFQEKNGSWGQIDAMGNDKRARAAARPTPLSRRYRAMLRSWQQSDEEVA